MSEASSGEHAGPVQPGDIVMALMPRRGDPDGPRRAAPALVLECERRDHLDGSSSTTRLRLAASFAGNLDRCYPGEFVVSGEEAAAAGLRGDRKFDTARPREVPFDRENLILGRSGDPRIGRLAPEDLARAVTAYGRACNAFGNLPSIPGMLPKPPRAGDLVYLYSPYHDAPDRPGAKPRPCIVTAVRRVTAEDGRSEVRVTYAPGTSQKLFQKRAGEMMLEDPARLEELGLNRAGKFKFAQEQTVPWTQAYICHSRPGPSIGRLTSAEIDQVKAARREVLEMARGEQPASARAQKGRAAVAEAGA